ncbi:energy transducer TonB [Pedobacter cryoconitis]|uniref:TonB family protein n=1 Tax=Pedobacter cryoconitis TaxID=188932 RepID=A0A7X0MLU0_9SPHI|nr:energy transducer TonB [Pedobacter cryoconitis]MBB6501753.1 TonB family protein [Pedobacter cryoconitis]
MFVDLSIPKHPIIMTKIFNTIAFLLLSLHLFAQEPETQIMRMDTINVRGKIIAVDGSKVSNVWVQSRTPNKKYFHGLNESTSTDSLGNFVLKGLKPTDTLSFRASGSDYTFINHGSRYITIKIAPVALRAGGADNPQITARRINKKKDVNFILAKDNNIYCFGPTDHAGFPGGTKNFVRYVNKNLVYPLSAIKNNIEGNVTVEFSVAKNGDVFTPKIINGLGYGCDEAAVNAILKSPRWIPGFENGKAVTSTFQIDVSFKIED